MTKEEAIKHLETYSTTNGSGQTTQAQHEEAKRMAIKALEQEPCPVDAIRIPENATNGDMIKAMFPLVSIATDGTYVHVEMRIEEMKACAGFYASWWNAPYMSKEDSNE